MFVGESMSQVFVFGGEMSGDEDLNCSMGKHLFISVNSQFKTDFVSLHFIFSINE